MHSDLAVEITRTRELRAAEVLSLPYLFGTWLTCLTLVAYRYDRTAVVVEGRHDN